MTEKVQALMVGTDPNGKGGVASVVTVLIQEGFLRSYGVRYITTHVGSSRRDKLRVLCRALFQLTVECISRRPLVHVHSASRASFYRKSLILAIARAAGCRTIFHLHGAEFQKFASLEAGPVLRWWIRHTLESSDVVLALSESWRVFLSKFAPAARVKVLPNSVKLGIPASLAAQHSGRILFLGRADQRKGIFDLLQALRLLVPQFPQVRLAIGGDGDLAAVRASAADLGITEYVEILGWVGAERKAQELASAEVFVLPSYDEGLPMAMLEAMAAQKAIVVTPVGGIPETVTDGQNGLLVPSGDVAALAAALTQILAEPKLGERLAVGARATIESRYSTGVVLDRLRAIYSELGAGEMKPAATLREGE